MWHPLNRLVGLLSGGAAHHKSFDGRDWLRHGGGRWMSDLQGLVEHCFTKGPFDYFARPLTKQLEVMHRLSGGSQVRHLAKQGNKMKVRPT